MGLSRNVCLGETNVSKAENMTGKSNVSNPVSKTPDLLLFGAPSYRKRDVQTDQETAA